MKLVIVESPSKAKTINKYLGKDYEVLASFGHIRDLAAKDGSVLPEKSFEMVWSIDSKNEKHIKAITSALSKADALYLASDPDREGEAISWHIIQELTRRKKLKDMPVYRVTFNEITKSAVLKAMEMPREIDTELVDAYLARRALDYLVGFNISPVLWRKLPGSRSAGRVQSVALRLVCDRENERDAFKSQEYWTFEGLFKEGKKELKATLSFLQGEKYDKFSVSNEKEAQKVTALLSPLSYHISKIEKKSEKRNPSPAFTTSTLQQEASKKLGFGTKKTMQLAQKLYEGFPLKEGTVGLITYMRTDGISLAQEAISEIRDEILKKYGKAYLPPKPRYYKNKSKNAQEAHEAIRPTKVSRSLTELKSVLDKDSYRLYELILKRTMACQMESALIDKTGIDVSSLDEQNVFRATGSQIVFDGFIKAYKAEEKSEEALLDSFIEGKEVDLENLDQSQHFTEPPARYTEASLVKKLEELGIGRPSTYASILSVLQDRSYVKLVSKAFVPEERGRLVTLFLENFFPLYVEYNFTADMENKLDEISAGKLPWKKVLEKFWTPFHQKVQDVLALKGSEVVDKIQEILNPTVFKSEEDRVCPKCKDGKLNIKIGRFGVFIGCSNYPECGYTRPLSLSSEEGDDAEQNEERSLGISSTSKKEIFLKKGLYGLYVEESSSEGKAKRASLPKGLSEKDVTLFMAEELLSLPKVLGLDKETNEEIILNQGRFGPYVGRGKTFASVRKPDSIFEMTLDRAKELIAAALQKNQAKELGQSEGEMVFFKIGRYGAYLEWKNLRAPLSKKDKEAGKVPSFEEALLLLKEKGKPFNKRTGRSSAKKATTKKTTTKKASAKKTAAKKTTAKKSAAKKTAKSSSLKKKEVETA
ncbi:MAG: type I DNA topoisomerase [Alphaproteobacteria bacterium]|nr:type I DNA topoisomerase [Alphaproteobacteria bacterium]